MAENNPMSIISVVQTASRGRALVATRFIHKGSIIMQEKPYAAVPFDSSELTGFTCSVGIFKYSEHELRMKQLSRAHGLKGDSFILAHRLMMHDNQSTTNGVCESLCGGEQLYVSGPRLGLGPGSGVKVQAADRIEGIKTAAEIVSHLNKVQLSISSTIPSSSHLSTSSSSSSSSLSPLGSNGPHASPLSSSFSSSATNITSIAYCSEVLSKISVNAFVIADELTNEAGIGVYAQCSAANHSCDPNALQVFKEEALLQLKAIRSIHPGEEICISYIDVTKPQHMRSKELRDTYGFECRCSRCCAELAGEHMLIRGFTCPNRGNSSNSYSTRTFCPEKAAKNENSSGHNETNTASNSSRTAGTNSSTGTGSKKKLRKCGGSLSFSTAYEHCQYKRWVIMQQDKDYQYVDSQMCTGMSDKADNTSEGKAGANAGVRTESEVVNADSDQLLYLEGDKSAIIQSIGQWTILKSHILYHKKHNEKQHRQQQQHQHQQNCDLMFMCSKCNTHVDTASLSTQLVKLVPLCIKIELYAQQQQQQEYAQQPEIRERGINQKVNGVLMKKVSVSVSAGKNMFEDCLSRLSEIVHQHSYAMMMARNIYKIFLDHQKSAAAAAAASASTTRTCDSSLLLDLLHSQCLNAKGLYLCARACTPSFHITVVLEGVIFCNSVIELCNKILDELSFLESSSTCSSSVRSVEQRKRDILAALGYCQFCRIRIFHATALQEMRSILGSDHALTAMTTELVYQVDSLHQNLMYFLR